jgi:hypothetical protein
LALPGRKVCRPCREGCSLPAIAKEISPRITYRTPDGERDTVRTLFGCIALLFCLRVLCVDILGLI